MRRRSATARQRKPQQWAGSGHARHCAARPPPRQRPSSSTSPPARPAKPCPRAPTWHTPVATLLSHACDMVVGKAHTLPTVWFKIEVGSRPLHGSATAPAPSAQSAAAGGKHRLSPPVASEVVDHAFGRLSNARLLEAQQDQNRRCLHCGKWPAHLDHHRGCVRQTSLDEHPRWKHCFLPLHAASTCDQQNISGSLQGQSNFHSPESVIDEHQNEEQRSHLEAVHPHLPKAGQHQTNACMDANSYIRTQPSACASEKAASWHCNCGHIIAARISAYMSSVYP